MDERYQEWVGALRAGRYDRAWQISDVLLRERAARGGSKHDGPRRHQQIWRGEPFEGARVLLRCYHGLGDTIQFIRFAPQLRARARELIVWCQPKLLGLIAGVRGVDRVLPLHDGAPEVAYDVDIECMELPHALRVGDDVGSAVPYLRAGVEPRGGREDELHVGLVWEASDWDRARSVPLDAVAPLTKLRGVRLYSLHPGAMTGALPIEDISEDEIDRLAARMRGLDLIVTVDTMTAHLAGALGLPVWTMLRAQCDWRWESTGETSRWYPTMRLLRQQRPGDWAPVLRDVRDGLCRLAQGKAARRRSGEP